MPKSKRPPTSGYARIAQAEEEEDSDAASEDEFHQNSLSNAQYAPIQPSRNSRMRMPDDSAPGSPNARRTSTSRRHRSNSGVDIKAINARFERWADEIAQKFKFNKQKDGPDDEQLEIHHSVFQAPEGVRPATAESLTADYDGAGATERMTNM